jgi:hypothetical protein
MHQADWTPSAVSGEDDHAARIKIVWIYVDGHKSGGDADHIKAFASRGAADEWLNENDPEGVALEVALEYEVIDK